MKVKDLQRFSGLQADDEVMVVRADGVGPILVPYSAIQNGSKEAAPVADDPDVEDLIRQLVLEAHPVNSYYWSNEPTDPSTLFGGTWTRIYGRFLWGRDTNESVGATGGAKTVALTTSTIPAHVHNDSLTRVTLSSHTHRMYMPAHTHTLRTHTHGTTHAHTGTHTHNFMKHTHLTAGFQRCGNEASGYGGTWTSGTDGTIAIYRNGQKMVTAVSKGEIYSRGMVANTKKNTSSSVSGYTDYTTPKSGTTGYTASLTGGDVGETYFPPNTSTYSTDNSLESASFSIGSTGNGSAPTHENMPPYVNAYCWRRTA